MPDKTEKQRRKEIVHALREEQRKSIRDGFPVPVLALKARFDFLDQRLAGEGCDHTLRLTREFIRQNAMDDRVVSWLKENGGHCDCEVVDNVEPVVADAFPDYEQIRGETDSVN
jgi:hypothetical protein